MLETPSDDRAAREPQRRGGAAGGDGNRRGPDIIAVIKDGFEALRPAERRVAEAVLADLRGAVAETNGELARRAGVSEPSVTRFCRAVGCEGVRDFKLKLAQSLVVGDLYLDATDPPMAEGEDAPPFWGPVLHEARRALREVERQLAPAEILAVAEAVAGARRVATFGLGGSASPLAVETQHRLFRYGVPITAVTDPYVMRMTAASLRPQDVVIAVSASGKTREVIEAVELARHYRACTIAVTAARSPLAAAVELPLVVDIAEYPDTLLPTAARFAYLAIIDLLAAATGYRMGSAARENLRRIKYAVLNHREGQVLEPLGD